MPRDTAYKNNDLFIKATAGAHCPVINAMLPDWGNG
uniref:Uncharacterized protein n=1 Tax=Anguilla anguilla TaxID=7936 RepID=A0A0E9VS73_ANGAN